MHSSLVVPAGEEMLLCFILVFGLNIYLRKNEGLSAVHLREVCNLIFCNGSPNGMNQWNYMNI